MSLRVAATALKERVSSNLSEVRRNVSDSLGEVKHGAHTVADRIGDRVEGVVEILPTLPNIPNPIENIETPVVKRGAGTFKLTMLQEARRQDDPTYDPKGCHMSKSAERLIIRSLFYFFAIAALVFLILAFVFQFGLGQASQAAIWAISAIFLGGALVLNTRIPRNEPNKCVGIAALMISVCSFAAFIIFCIGASNNDLDKLGMGLGIFVTCFATIAAGMWAYNLWFPSKRANAIIREDNQKMLGTFQILGLAPEQGTLAQVERGTPGNIRNMHMACNVVTVILWYVFAIIIIFFTFDIRGLVTDTSRFTPPPDQRIPITNTTIPPEPSPYSPNTTSPTMEPTSPPPTRGPTLPGATYSPTLSPTNIPSDVPTHSPSRAPVTSRPSRAPTTSGPSFAPTVSAPSAAPATSAPSDSPTASVPTFSPSTASPSSAPITEAPTESPETSSPSSAPSRTPSTSRPSRTPSAVPTSSEPSSAPSNARPTSSPITSVPTDSPTTSVPSFAPVTSEPTQSPAGTMAPTTSKRPSRAPTTQRPSRAPVTARPSRNPSFKPSRTPTTVFPSRTPTNQSPTRSPTRPPTLLPTRLPTSRRPSRAPITSRPSKAPTTARPSRAPITARPSRTPTTARPSRTPTRKPTTLMPTSRAPSSSPTPPTGAPTRQPTFVPSSSPTKTFVPVPESPPAIPPGTTIVGGTLHFVCVGDPNARPAVIFEHDVGASLDVWAWVQNVVSNQTYACAYSRRGYGYSSQGNRPRTVAFTSVELKVALDALNLTSPVVLVGHGFAGFQLRRFYAAFPERVAGMVFVDAYSTQCFKKPKCDGKEKKGDSEGYGQLESIIPFGFIRALAYSGVSFPGPAGRCASSLPEAWGSAQTPARARFLASILSPAFWSNALAEDSDMPTSCALAAQGPGNSVNNKISVPLTVITSDRDFFVNDGPCGAEQKNAGGGSIGGKNRKADTSLFEVDYSSHWSLLCDEKNATFVGGLVNDLVQTVRLTSKSYSKFPQVGRMNWTAANSFCGARGMRLPQLYTSQNQEDVDDLDLNRDDDNFWLGATATAVGQPFRWLGSSANINSFYTNWDNKEPSGHPSRTCLEITRSNQKWRAADCSVFRYVMCERDTF